MKFNGSLAWGIERYAWLRPKLDECNSPFPVEEFPRPPYITRLNK